MDRQFYPVGNCKSVLILWDYNRHWRHKPRRMGSCKLHKYKLVGQLGNRDLRNILHGIRCMGFRSSSSQKNNWKMTSVSLIVFVLVVSFFVGRRSNLWTFTDGTMIWNTKTLGTNSTLRTRLRTFEIFAHFLTTAIMIRIALVTAAAQRITNIASQTFWKIQKQNLYRCTCTQIRNLLFANIHEQVGVPLTTSHFVFCPHGDGWHCSSTRKQRKTTINSLFRIIYYAIGCEIIRSNSHLRKWALINLFFSSRLSAFLSGQMAIYVATFRLNSLLNVALMNIKMCAVDLIVD